MGTPDFAVVSLRRLAEDGHEIVGVFTQPDKPGNRKMLTRSPVKEYALSVGLPVYQPERMRGEEPLALLRSLEPELTVVAAYGQILPEDILNVPRYGSINVHASILPKYRGAAPINRAILDGETETGVNVNEGEYYLVETKAPTNYLKLRDPVRIFFTDSFHQSPRRRMRQTIPKFIPAEPEIVDLHKDCHFVFRGTDHDRKVHFQFPHPFQGRRGILGIAVDGEHVKAIPAGHQQRVRNPGPAHAENHMVPVDLPAGLYRDLHIGAVQLPGKRALVRHGLCGQGGRLVQGLFQVFKGRKRMKRIRARLHQVISGSRSTSSAITSSSTKAQEGSLRRKYPIIHGSSARAFRDWAQARASSAYSGLSTSGKSRKILCCVSGNRSRLVT